MERWYENVILVAGILGLIPAVVLALAYGPFAFLLVPIEAVAAFALYRHARRRRLHPERAAVEPAPAPRRVAPMPPVDDGSLAAVPEPVTACPRCGFLGIRMPTIGDGLWPGGGELGDRMVCPRCDWQGLPARFDTRADYGAFLRELASGV